MIPHPANGDVAAPARDPCVARRWGRALFGSALLSGVLLCLPLFTGIPLALDEHGSYWTINADVPGSVLERSLHCTAIPPLSSWVQQASLALLGRSEASLRFPSALAYWLALAVTYLIGRDLDGPLTGGLAALVLAWDPLALNEVRFARSYGLVLLLSALLLWATLRWRRERRAWRWPFLWGVIAAALAWTHYLAIPFATLCGLALVVPRAFGGSSEAPVWSRLSVGAAIAVGLSLPLAPAAIRVWEWGPFLNFQTPAASPLVVIGSFWWLGVPAALATAWLLARVAGASVVNTSPPNHPAILLGMLSIVPTLLLALAARGDFTSLANPRYRVTLAVPAAVLLALLVTRKSRPWGACLACLVGLAALWIVEEHSPWRPARLDHPIDGEWREMASIVSGEGGPGDPIFVQSGLVESSLMPAFYDDRLFSSYVACTMGKFYLHTGQPRYGLPFQWETSSEMRDYYRDLLDRRRGGDVWLAAATDTDLNRAGITGLEELLREAGFVEHSRRDFSRSLLVRYRQRSRTLPQESGVGQP